MPEPDTSALVAFITARLDEDERVARRIETTWRCIAGTGEIVASDGARAEVCAEAHWEGVGEHMARHDPARVLREVEAKRNMVERAQRHQRWAETTPTPAFRALATSSQIMLSFMATVWSGHPDYLAEWSPERFGGVVDHG